MDYCATDVLYALLIIVMIIYFIAIIAYLYDDYNKRDYQMPDLFLDKYKINNNNNNNIDILSIDNNNYSTELNFDDLEIAGLNEDNKMKLKKFYYIRKLDDDTKKKLNLEESKGMVLHGKPGVGKTKIAREIIKLFNAKSVTMIAGPELVNKYFGESEKAIRKLFEKAENDDNPNNLHIIVIDEMDSCVGKRKDSEKESTFLGNNITNQFLTKLDGFKTMVAKILIIGTTNNIDLLDPALIRPGRLDTVIEINTPDVKGRKEIFDLYLNKVSSEFKSSDIDTKELSEMGEFTGAEIKNIIDNTKTNLLYKNSDKVVITQNDLRSTINEFTANASKISNKTPKIDLEKFLSMI